MAKRNFMKFGMDGIPLGYFKFVNFLQSVIPTWRMLKVVRWKDHPPPWCHYHDSQRWLVAPSPVATLIIDTNCSCCHLWMETWTIWYHVHWTANHVIARAATCQWSFELFVLQSISCSANEHTVLNCYVVKKCQKNIYSVEGSELLGILSN
jgi:hypothetical protein